MLGRKVYLKVPDRRLPVSREMCETAPSWEDPVHGVFSRFIRSGLQAPILHASHTSSYLSGAIASPGWLRVLRRAIKVILYTSNGSQNERITGELQDVVLDSLIGIYGS